MHASNSFTYSKLLLYLQISFSPFECHSSCKTITVLHLCHKPTGAVQAPRGLAESVLYVHAIMLMCIQLHDCPLWPSAVPPAIDQGRVSGARSGTSRWWIYQLLRQACSVFPDDGGDSSLPLRYRHVETFRSGSFQETRSGQSVSAQTLMSTWKLSNLITVYSRLILSPSLQNVMQLLTFLWQWIIIDHLHQDYGC